MNDTYETESVGSEFSDEHPTTTTISTVAVQAGSANIVLAVLKCGSWIKVRIQKMDPDLFELGTSSTEAAELLEIHRNLCNKLAQSSNEQAQVYAAMAESLGRAWKDLQKILKQRENLVELSYKCFEQAEGVICEAEKVEKLSNSRPWGKSVTEVQELLLEHQKLKQCGLLEPSHQMLATANTLLKLLCGLPSQQKASPEHASTVARERVAIVTAKAGMARRRAEASWSRRERLLRLRVNIVSLENELERIVNWFVKNGEPRLGECTSGASLAECEEVLSRLNQLAEDTKDIQMEHAKLSRQFQQNALGDLTSIDEQGNLVATSKNKYGCLDDLLALDEEEIRLSGTHSRNASLNRSTENKRKLDLMEEGDEDMWRATHGAYSELSKRFRTTEIYIWEFIDRIEARRRKLQMSVVFYSECHQVLQMLNQLESELSVVNEKGINVGDTYLSRLDVIDMRIPGLRDILSDIKVQIDESSAGATLASITVPYDPQMGPAIGELFSGRTSLALIAEDSMNQELLNIEIGLAKCRELCTKFEQRGAKLEFCRDIEMRIETMISWMNDVAYRTIVECYTPGTTLQSVADFEATHRRLEKEMSARERQIQIIRVDLAKISGETDSRAVQQSMDTLQSSWDRCESTIRFRLNMSEKWKQVLTRIREDDYHWQTVSELAEKVNIGSSGASIEQLLSLPMETGSIERVRRELKDIRLRLQSQQDALHRTVQEITMSDDQHLKADDTCQFCKSQIQINLERLDRVRVQLENSENAFEFWSGLRNHWMEFNFQARKVGWILTYGVSSISDG
ncbi:hypothetical protein Ciccas_009872 [Cichlidogyrus casuarinus]|uniref:Uncharacterized protein n=1 Tax=Cichlidogyrus casuarinus TaxID=1844966 RepID=A0ABD2PXM1_9PLAT